MTPNINEPDIKPQTITKTPINESRFHYDTVTNTKQGAELEKAREDIIAQEIQTMNEYEVGRLSALIDGLLELNDQELQELDTLITPRAATLLSKAFGSALGAALQPLASNEPSNTSIAEQTIAPKDETTTQMQRETPTQSKVKNFTAQQLRAMISDPRYWKERDPQLVREVSEGYKILHPTA